MYIYIYLHVYMCKYVHIYICIYWLLKDILQYICIVICVKRCSCLGCAKVQPFANRESRLVADGLELRHDAAVGIAQGLQAWKRQGRPGCLTLIIYDVYSVCVYIYICFVIHTYFLLYMIIYPCENILCIHIYIYIHVSYVCKFWL